MHGSDFSSWLNYFGYFICILRDRNVVAFPIFTRILGLPIPYKRMRLDWLKTLSCRVSQLILKTTKSKFVCFAVKKEASVCYISFAGNHLWGLPISSSRARPPETCLFERSFALPPGLDMGKLETKFLFLLLSRQTNSSLDFSFRPKKPSFKNVVQKSFEINFESNYIADIIEQSHSHVHLADFAILRHPENLNFQ